MRTPEPADSLLAGRDGRHEPGSARLEEVFAVPAPHDPDSRMTPHAAFERLCVEVVGIEAIVNAASAAIDACAPPEGPRQAFDRAQSLIGDAAEKAADALALVGELKAAVHAYIEGLR